MPKPVQFPVSLGLAPLLILWCLLLGSLAMADDPKSSPYLDKYPRSMPISLQREVAQALPAAEKRALREKRYVLLASPEKIHDVNAQLDRLRSTFAQRLDEYSPALTRVAPDASRVGTAPSDGIEVPRAVPINPFDRGVEELLDKAIEENLRTLVNRPLNSEERKIFLNEFPKVDIRKHWKTIQAIRGGRAIDPAAQKANVVSPVVHWLVPFIGGIIGERTVNKALDAPDEFKKANQEELEQQRLTWIQNVLEDVRRNQKTLGEKVDRMWSTVERSEERIQRVQLGTLAIFWTMGELQRATGNLASDLNRHAEEEKKANNTLLGVINARSAEIQKSINAGITNLHQDHVQQNHLLQQNLTLTEEWALLPSEWVTLGHFSVGHLDKRIF
jgi:hypothetical protein